MTFCFLKHINTIDFDFFSLYIAIHKMHLLFVHYELKFKYYNTGVQHMANGLKYEPIVSPCRNCHHTDKELCIALQL